MKLLKYMSLGLVAITYLQAQEVNQQLAPENHIKQESEKQNNNDLKKDSADTMTDSSNNKLVREILYQCSNQIWLVTSHYAKSLQNDIRNQGDSEKRREADFFKDIGQDAYIGHRMVAAMPKQLLQSAATSTQLCAETIAVTSISTAATMTATSAQALVPAAAVAKTTAVASTSVLLVPVATATVSALAAYLLNKCIKISSNMI